MDIIIYFDDLNEEGKEKVLSAYNIENPRELNMHIFPLFILKENGHLFCSGKY